MRLRKLVPSELDREQRGLYDAIVGGDRAKGPQAFPLVDDDGSLTGPFGVMLHAPEVGGPLQALGSALRFATSLSDRIREVAILQVARALDSEFEWWAHERVARGIGIAEHEIAAISTGSFRGRDEAEQVSYEIVEKLLAPGEPSDDDVGRAVALLGEQQLVELTILVGYYQTLAQTMSLFGIGIPDGG